MSLADLSSQGAVLQALAEYDRLGRDEFLRRNGFGKARAYFVEHAGSLYDSKAIAGVAHGYQFPDRGRLSSADFSGGETTVRRKLEEIGFTVRRVSRP
jgi:hypothetical protein